MWNRIKKWFGWKEPTPEVPLIYRAAMPRTRVVATFMPTRDFRGETKAGELLGLYKQGRHYYIREGNNMLAELCADWETEGLIKIARG